MQALLDFSSVLCNIQCLYEGRLPMRLVLQKFWFTVLFSLRTSLSRQNFIGRQSQRHFIICGEKTRKSAAMHPTRSDTWSLGLVSLVIRSNMYTVHDVLRFYYAQSSIRDKLITSGDFITLLEYFRFRLLYIIFLITLILHYFTLIFFNMI